MGEENKPGPSFPFSGLVVLFAALGVITFTNIPFHVTRPSVPEVREPFEKVRARLWQDPFLAVIDHVKSQEKSASMGKSGQFGLLDKSKNDMTAEGSLAKQIKGKLEKGKVTVLGVMEFGAPYAEETEMRIRNRFAVLAGLRRLGFVPEDSEHLDYIKVAANEVSSSQPSLSTIMPFEWLRLVSGDKEPKGEKGSRQEKDYVLLLWINDDVFQSAPLDRLARLVDCLELKDQNRINLNDRIRFKVIGPAGSTTLRRMVAETTCTGCHTSTVSMPATGVEFFSPFATVDAVRLLRSVDEEAPSSQSEMIIEQRFANNGFKFTNTIRSDRELADEVVKELALRRVDAEDEKDHIVLIAEWDTYYGRSLPLVYKRAFTSQKEKNVGKRVHSFSYLRGLDGRLPGDKEDKEESGATQAKTNAEDTIKRLEQPMGKSQYDYLRRLADEIYRLDKRLQAKKEGSIKAIGVLGSDFHDKYLVLQALRQRLPAAIFFATDLDARLLHPDKIKWTRNIVVASNFNLALRDDIQGDVPPFRNSYQTSVFYAVLKAFSEDNYLKGLGIDELNMLPSPRIFEVGRYKAFDLTAGDESKEADIHPVRHDIEASKRLFLKMVGTILLMGILLIFASVTVKKVIQTAIAEQKMLIIVGAALLLSSVAAFYFVMLGNQSEEPFSFFQGISIWPTEILRLLAIVCALYFLWCVRASLNKSNEFIAKEFVLTGVLHSNESDDPAENAELQEGDKRGNLIVRLKRFWIAQNYDWEVHGKGKEFTMDDLWAKYLSRDLRRSRIRRLAPIALTYFFLCGLIIKIEPPVSPVRGPVSCWLDSGMIILSVIALLTLVFYVFDITRICRRFIDLAVGAEKMPKWSQSTMKQFATELDEEDAAPMREWILIHLIAKRTDTVGKLIFYPVIVWFIIFISRSYYFDNWQTPIGLAVVISLAAVFAWSSAFVLRRSAERARKDAVHRLKTDLVSVLSQKDPDQDQVKRIEFVIKEISDVREGAFAPYTQHPAVQALAVPFGGIGGVYLIEFLTKMNI